jgi:hypothetical protein
MSLCTKLLPTAVLWNGQCVDVYPPAAVHGPIEVRGLADWNPFLQLEVIPVTEFHHWPPWNPKEGGAS